MSARRQHEWAMAVCVASVIVFVLIHYIKLWRSL